MGDASRAEDRSGPDGAFLAYTIPNLAVSRTWPGNNQFDMLTDPARPGVVRFCEGWGSAAVQQAYMAWRTAAGGLASLMSFLAEPPTLTASRRVEA